MKRRSFISLATVAPLSMAHSGEEEDQQEQIRNSWIESRHHVNSGVFFSAEKELRLEVSLIGNDDPVVEKIVKTSDGEESVFWLQGSRLPRWLRPADGIIKNFRFFWGDREIPIEQRYWNDFGGCSIEKSSLDKGTIPEEQEYAFDEFLQELDGPRVILSADKGTALIEWEIRDTDACCDHKATVRWIIGKSGAVMRHRHQTPNPC